MQEQTKPRLYSVDEAAAALEAHPHLLRRWIRDGRLGARRIGREWVITAFDLERFQRPAKRERKALAQRPAPVVRVPD